MANKELFKEMLKNRRKVTKKKLTKKTWLYPFQYERTYRKKISALQREITGPATKFIRENLRRWINEYKQDEQKADSSLLNKMTHKIKKGFKQDQFSREIKDFVEWIQRILDQQYGDGAPKIRTLITGIGDDVSAWNLNQWDKFTKDMLGVEFIVTEPWEKEVIEAWGETNFELIKSLGNEYIKDVNRIVSEGVQFGKSYNSMVEEIAKLNKHYTQRRATLIARDQVGKLNGQLTKRRQRDAGIDMYSWLTAGDERVRGNPSGPYKNANPSHYEMGLGGKVYRWDNNNVYSTDGGKTWKKRSGKMTNSIPGEDILCRCTALPYFDDIIEQVDQEIEEEVA